MDILVSGSLAYDRIMTFPGRFGDHIMPDRIHNLNVSFTVESVVERPGGCAGNIAYCLVLLGEQPQTIAAIGYDCARYFEWMKRNGVPWDAIRVVDEEATAGAYITTDLADNQITGFHPGAMMYPADHDVGAYDPERTIAIVAPGNLDDMRNFTRTYQQRGIPYIFDPGQSLTAWDGADLRACIDGAAVLIANDYEMGLITNLTGLDDAGLQSLAGAVITTRGEHGSQVAENGRVTPVPVVPPTQVVDPTGAGDSYRGGLLKGMVEGCSLAESALMGSVAASFAIEVRGTQEYHFTMEQFQERLSAAKAGV